MKEALRILNALAGGALIAAGLLLAQIPWIHIAQPPGSDAFRLIQFHFVATGLVSIWGASLNKPGGLVASVSLLAAFPNIWLAYLAVKAGDPARLWPLVFVVVSALNLIILLANDASVEEMDPEAAEDETMNEGDIIPPDYGAHAIPVYQFAATKLIATAFGLATTIAMLVFGSIYVELLSKAIFHDADISFVTAAKFFMSEENRERLIDLGVYIAIPVVVYGVFYLLEAIAGSASRRGDVARSADFDRNLDEAERSYIRESIGLLLDYLNDKHYENKLRAFYFVGSVLAVSGLIVGMFIAPAIEYLIGQGLEPLRSGGAAIFYSGPAYLGGGAFGALAGAGAFWSLFQWLGARWPGFGEYMFARAGWNSMNSRPRTPGELLWVLVRHVRAHALDIGDPFEPKKFLQAAFREREGLIYKATIMLVILTIVFTAADVARFMLVTNDGVTYSKYLHFRTEHVPLDELDGVELRCNLFKPDEKTGEVNLGLGYILVKDGQFRIDILSDDVIAQRLESVEALDESLRRDGVPFSRAVSAGFLQGARPGFIQTCAAEIDKRYKPEAAARLEKLLRVGEDLPNAAP